MEQQGFSCMVNYVDYLVFYFDDASCKISGFFKYFCWYWRVELSNVKFNEFISFFIFNSFEPFNEEFWKLFLLLCRW